MRIARKLMLLAIAAVAALAMMAPVANATSPIEVVEANGTHCPTVASGGCVVHAQGSATLFFHIFGIESTEANCQVEFEGKLDEDGGGQITSYTPTPGDANCGTVAPACASTLPWPGAGESDGGTVTAHFDVCIDPSEAGTCNGEFITTVTETGTSPESQTFSATDLRIGASSFCEVTVNVTSESMPVAPHENVHLR